MLKLRCFPHHHPDEPGQGMMQLISGAPVYAIRERWWTNKNPMNGKSMENLWKIYGKSMGKWCTDKKTIYEKYSYIYIYIYIYLPENPSEIGVVNPMNIRERYLRSINQFVTLALCSPTKIEVCPVDSRDSENTKIIDKPQIQDYIVYSYIPHLFIDDFPMCSHIKTSIRKGISHYL